MEKFADIIEKIESQKLIKPPDNLVAGVMKGMDKLETSLLFRFYRFLFQSRQFTFDPISALRRGTSYDEICLCFMMVAFAHLTLAVVLLMGLKSIDTRTLLPPLLWWQPWLSLFLACWLVFWGFILKKNAGTGIKGVRAAAFFYIEAVVINGALLFMEFSRILLLVPYIAVMTGSAIAAGIFLAFISGSDNKRIIRGASALT